MVGPASAPAVEACITVLSARLITVVMLARMIRFVMIFSFPEEPPNGSFHGLREAKFNFLAVFRDISQIQQLQRLW